MLNAFHKWQRKPVAIIGRSFTDEDHLLSRIIEGHQRAHRTLKQTASLYAGRELTPDCHPRKLFCFWLFQCKRDTTHQHMQNLIRVGKHQLPVNDPIQSLS